MIRKLTKDEFVEIATNGIKINFYDSSEFDYIDSLLSFIDNVDPNAYVSDSGQNWCIVEYFQKEMVKIVIEDFKLMFLLDDADLSNNNDRKGVGRIINTAYMHSVAWHAIHNDGIISQEPTHIIEPWPM